VELYRYEGGPDPHHPDGSGHEVQTLSGEINRKPQDKKKSPFYPPLQKGERGGFSFYCWLLTVGYPSTLDPEP
jgi:hypothetical protein